MHNFRNILLVIEPGVDNQAAIDRAIELARSNQADLSLISVVEDAPLLKRTAPDVLETLVADRENELQAIAERWKVTARIHVPVGAPFLEVIRYVLQNGLDLVVKSEAKGRHRFRALGSTDMHLFRKCPCPVWVVRSEGGGSCRRILAAVDIGPEGEEETALARRVLEIATSLAKSKSAELHVLHAWSLAYEDALRSPRSGMGQLEVDRMATDEENLRTGRLQALTDDVVAATMPKQGEASGAPRLHVEKGDPSDVIPEAVEHLDIELVVMGTVGRTGIPGFFIGNTAEEVLGQIECSVMAIKPPRFESPVTIS